MKKLVAILVMAAMAAIVLAAPGEPLGFFRDQVNPTTTNDGRVAVVGNSFSSSTGCPTIYVYNYRQTEPCFTLSGNEPRWSPDGSKLAYRTNDSSNVYGLKVVRVYGNILGETLFDTNLNNGSRFGQLTWVSNDTIMLVTYKSLVRYNINTGVKEVLKTFNDIRDCTNPEYLGQGQYVYSGANGVLVPGEYKDAIWDQDGNRLYYLDYGLIHKIRAMPNSPYRFIFIDNYNQVWSYSKLGLIDLLDGINSDVDFSPNGEYACASTLSLPQGTYLNRIAMAGDCNGDFIVDDIDFLLVIGNFGNISSIGDCNGDGVVDDLDFLLVISNFGDTGN